MTVRLFSAEKSESSAAMMLSLSLICCAACEEPMWLAFPSKFDWMLTASVWSELPIDSSLLAHRTFAPVTLKDRIDWRSSKRSGGSVGWWVSGFVDLWVVGSLGRWVVGSVCQWVGGSGWLYPSSSILILILFVFLF